MSAQDGKQRKGFTMFPDALFGDPRLTLSQAAVLLAILKHDWAERGDGCTASYRTLADETWQSRSAVFRAVKYLDKKFVKVERDIKPSETPGKKGKVYKPSCIRVLQCVRDLLPPPDFKPDRLPSPARPAKQMIRGWISRDYSGTGVDEPIECERDNEPMGFSDNKPIRYE
jgi:hypothetical protein